MGDYQTRSVGLHTTEQGMLHPGVDYSSREPVPAAPGTASSRVSSEYNRHNRKSRVPGVSKNATPPAAFGK